MKKANLVLMAALAAAGLVGVAGGSLLPVSVAVAAEKEKPAAKQKLSPAVQKPLVAAQNAMTAKNWDEALVQIQAAQAVDGPALIWFEIAEEQNVFPMMPAGKGLSDLIEDWGAPAGQGEDK